MWIVAVIVWWARLVGLRRAWLAVVVVCGVASRTPAHAAVGYTWQMT